MAQFGLSQNTCLTASTTRRTPVTLLPMLMLIVLMLLGGCGKKGTLTLPEKPQTENSASVGKTDRYSQSNPLTDLKPSQTTQQETP